jgi:hypothetical protein
MAHLKAADAEDLKSMLGEIRALENLKEKGTGTFYYKSTPFLHFHTKDGLRYAHVKMRDGNWQELPIDFNSTAASRKKFFAAVVKFHQAFRKL